MKNNRAQYKSRNVNLVINGCEFRSVGVVVEIVILPNDPDWGTLATVSAASCCTGVAAVWRAFSGTVYPELRKVCEI